MIHMKTASMRELRTNFPRLERWLADGEDVEITKRGEVVARLVPPARTRQRKIELPDFHARVQSVFGKRKLRAKDSAGLRDALRGER